MTTSTLPVADPIRRPSGINFRLLGFIAIFAVLLGYPLYIYLDSMLSGGIKQEGEFTRVDLKAMSTFTMDQKTGSVNDVPERFRALDGKKVILIGEIAPGGFEARGVDQYFQLVYSVQKCCYSGKPLIQHFIQATIPPENVRNIDGVGGGEVEVRGVLTVKVTPETKSPNDDITGVYHLRVESMKAR
jgi:hypothetical protein